MSGDFPFFWDLPHGQVALTDFLCHIVKPRQFLDMLLIDGVLLDLEVLLKYSDYLFVSEVIPVPSLRRIGRMFDGKSRYERIVDPLKNSPWDICGTELAIDSIRSFQDSKELFRSVLGENDIHLQIRREFQCLANKVV
jgi:hypothetical protein